MKDLSFLTKASVSSLLNGNEEYSAILRDVADRIGADYNGDASDETVGQCIIDKLFTESLLKASDEDLNKLLAGVGYVADCYNRQTAVDTLMTVWNAGDAKSRILLISEVSAILKYFTGSGLSVASDASVSRVAADLIGPAYWALTAIVAQTNAGLFYKKVLPTVIHAEYIRRIAEGSALESAC